MDYRWDQGERQTHVAVASAPLGAGADPPSIRAVVTRFDQVQCRVSFKAHEVLTRVNVTDSSIEAVPGNEIEWPPWPDAVSEKASRALLALSRSDNGFGGSRLGEAMAFNAVTYMNITSQDLD